MKERFVIELEIQGDNIFLNSLVKSIEPDVRSVPSSCRVEAWINRSFYLLIECEDLSDFRALFTSYFNIISVLIKLYLEFKG